MAPEIREGKSYDGRKIDLFSLGIVLFIIVRGHLPFPEASVTNKNYCLLVKKKQEDFFKSIHCVSATPSFKDLISRLLCYNPENRMTLRELREHEWL